jgi:hypothetical protein
LVVELLLLLDSLPALLLALPRLFLANCPQFVADNSETSSKNKLIGHPTRREQVTADVVLCGMCVCPKGVTKRKRLSV